MRIRDSEHAREAHLISLNEMRWSVWSTTHIQIFMQILK